MCAPDPPLQEPQRKPGRRPRTEWVLSAMHHVLNHPEWPDLHIAESVGIHPSQLSRCEEYQLLAQTVREPELPLGGDTTTDPDSGLTPEPGRLQRLSGLGATASHIGCPASWLRDEALAGRIPHIAAGKRLIFSPDAVAAVLLKRAAETPEPRKEQ